MNKEFFFYLDAWQYCSQNNIALSSISRKDWKTWEIKTPSRKKYPSILEVTG